MKKTRREYSETDAYMIKASRVMHKLFNENIADFMALDNTLNSNFGLEWLTKINTALTVNSHHLAISVQKQKTEELMQQMELCRIKYNEVKFFAKKAFRHSKAIQAEFGTAAYAKASINKVKMITFMDALYNACLKYQQELISVGFNQTEIEEVSTLGKKLLELSSIQEMSKRNILVQTNERVETLNQCYRDAKLVMDAAKIIYRKDYARRKLFVYSAKPSVARFKSPLRILKSSGYMVTVPASGF